MKQGLSGKYKNHWISGPDKWGAKLLFCCIVIAVFMKMFIYSGHIDWQSKYKYFNVPANSYPGGDARNIQVTAYCARQGYSYFGENSCQVNAVIVRQVYPEASVPPLNYPSIWVKAYSFFKNDSENFFKLFWIGNALLLLLAIASLAFNINYRILPFALFSPITLLTIERGNIDGIAFFFTFFPMLIFSSKKLHGFFLGFASAIKIFPLFGYLAFFKKNLPFIDTNIIIGGLVALPFILPSFLEINDLLIGTSFTPKIFHYSYGLTSLKFAPYFSTHDALSHTLIIGFILFTIVAVGWAWRNKALRYEIECEIKELCSKELFMLAVSICIFLITFIFFTNWAYRLIFLIPAFFVLSNGNSKIIRFMFGNIFAIFWLPMIPYGWYLQNLACLPLAPLLLFLMLIILNREAGNPLKRFDINKT